MRSFKNFNVFDIEERLSLRAGEWLVDPIGVDADRWIDARLGKIRAYPAYVVQREAIKFVIDETWGDILELPSILDADRLQLIAGQA